MSRITRPVAFIIVIAVASLGTNAVLAWRWNAERQAFRDLVARQQTEIQTASTENQTLSAENLDFRQDIAKKNQELAAKLAELAAKQTELDGLTKQLDDRKKELDTKAKELTEAQKRINDQKSQLDANSSELSKLRDRPPLFSFQVKSSSLADVEAKKAAVQQVVTDTYDTIQEVYGKAYLLHSVTITFVDSFSNDNASGEIIISNSKDGLAIDIRIKDFDKNSFADVNTIIHEVVHAFHGLAVLEPVAFEEGIAVATSDVVMTKMIAAGKLPRFSPLYIRLSEAEYQSKMNSMSISRNTDVFYGSDDAADYYQILGKSWMKLYEADSQFFKKFNEKIYAKKGAGQEVTEQLVLDTVKEVLPSATLTGAAWLLH